MSTFATVLIAIFVFGFLIFIHEFGHFIVARLFHVTVKEFSIGMGPRLVYYDSKKSGTRYSLAMFPIGGFVSMAGEDATDPEVAEDPNSFEKKPAWQRFLITIAGATVNIVAGFLAMLILTSFIRIGGTEIGAFVEPTEENGYFEATSSEKLEIGDIVLKVNGKRVSVSDELAYEIMRCGYEGLTMTVRRGGEVLEIPDVNFPTEEESGQTVGMMDFRVYEVKKTVGSVLSFSWHKSILIVRMCWESLYDLVTGRYSVQAVSGPVGITSAIGTAANAGLSSLCYMIVLISINLGLMNLLPLPALDGGRALTTLVEMLTGKRLPPKVENTINTVGLILLLGLSAVIMVKDIINLF